METDASGTGLWAVLFEKQHNLPQGWSARQQHTQTHCICYKTWVAWRKRYSIIDRETLDILYKLQKFHHYCFIGELIISRDHKQLVAMLKKVSQYCQRTTMKSTENTSIQSKNHIQAWARPAYSRLVLQTKPQGTQRCRNTWHADKY